MINTEVFPLYVIDDGIEEGTSQALIELQENVPRAQFFGYRFFGELPRDGLKGKQYAIMLDCFGYENGKNTATTNVMDMFNDFEQDELPNAVLILSGDEDYINGSVEYIKNSIKRRSVSGQSQFNSIQIYSVHRHEIGLVSQLLKDRSIQTDALTCETTGLREFLNKTYELTLPTAAEQLTEMILANEYLSPMDILKLYKEGNFAPEKVLKQMKDSFLFAWESGMTPSVLPPDDWIAGEDESHIDNYLSFERFSGVSVKGVAAFNADDVERNYKQDQGSILVVLEYQPALVLPLLGKISGVIVLGDSDTAHTAILFNNHKISGLFGAKTPFQFIAEAEDAKLTFGNDQTIQRGQVITIDTDFKGLSAQDLRIKNTSISYYKTWFPVLRDILEATMSERGISPLPLKASIGSLNEINNLGCDIGLVRTEHLTVEEPDALRAFRQAVLLKNDRSRKFFEQTQHQIFVDFLRSIGVWNQARIRLLDALPEDIFDLAEQKELESSHGKENMRGVQLATKFPALYKRQIRALCDAFQQVIKECEDWDCGEVKPLEIMVPTVRTLAEVKRVKGMLNWLTAQFGIASTQYRFGVMMETLDAGQNIEEIAPHCDFMSIGSNDYTSEFFNCDRSDWTKRRDLTHDLGGTDPFIVLHRNVVVKLTDIVGRARTANPNIKIDLCGDHGADPVSLERLAPLKLDAISVAPTYKNLQALPIFMGYKALEKA